VYEGANRNMPARNTLVQLLACTPTLRARMHSVTDRQTDRQTDDTITPIADHTDVAVRSAISRAALGMFELFGRTGPPILGGRLFGR